MVPQTYPSQLNLSTGQQEMVVFFLSSVTGLERWRDYIPVKLVTFPGIEGRTDANGFIAVGALPSITGKTAFNDYVPVFIDAAATDAWEVDNSGYIPYGLSGAGTASLSLGFVSTEFLDPRITFTRASTATRFNSLGVLETVAVDKPRFDYNPATKEPLGLLIEEARTNNCTNSASWGSSLGAGATRITSTVPAPNGVVEGYTYQNCSGATTWSAANTAAGQTGTVLLSSTAYTTSIYLRGTTATTCIFSVRDQSTGAITSSSALALTAQWQRVAVTMTTGAATTDVGWMLTGANGDVATWGMQVEQGAFATSLIPTTTVAVTRAADQAVMTGANFSSWFNPPIGTFIIEASTYAAVSGNSRNIMDLAGNEILFGIGANLVRTHDGTTGNDNTTTGGLNTSIKSAMFYDAANSLKGNTRNGVAVVTSAYSGFWTTAAEAALGRAANRSLALNGHIRSIRYYPTKLSDATIQALTA